MTRSTPIHLAPLATRSWRRSIAVAGLLAIVAPAAVAAERSPTDEVAEIDRLRDEWARLRRDAIEGIVHEAMLDADTRTSWRRDDATIRYDGGWRLETPEATFRVNGRVHTRWLVNRRPDASGDTTRSGFDVRRMQFTFRGSLPASGVGFKLQASSGASGGAFRSTTVVATIELSDDWVASGGRFKLPFLREQLASSNHLLAVERSLVHQSTTLGRSDGVSFTRTGDRDSLTLAFSNGAKTPAGAALGMDAEWAFTARFERAVEGAARDVRSMSAPRDAARTLVVGVAGHHERGEHGVGGAATRRTSLTVDGAFVQGDVVAFAAYVFDSMDGPGGPRVDRHGAVVQVGRRFTDAWEAFVRGEWGDAPGEDDLAVVTAGVTRHLVPGHAKWTTDVGFALDGVGATWASGGAGWMADAAGGRGQVVARSQIVLHH